jgi:multisubunit Na+/H+ antiporter MnhG subunit
MDAIPPVLRYFAMTSTATLSAIFFSLAVENWKNSKYKYVLAFIASLLLTPVGAWVISTFSRINSLQSQQADKAV